MRCAKQTFDTKAEARRALVNPNTGKRKLEPYYCQECNAWHVGHRARKRAIGVRKR